VHSDFWLTSYIYWYIVLYNLSYFHITLFFLVGSSTEITCAHEKSLQNYDFLTQAASGNPNSCSRWLRYYQHHPVWNTDLTLLWRHHTVYMPMTSSAFQSSCVLLWFRGINKELSRGRGTWSLMAKLQYLFVEPWKCLHKKVFPLNIDNFKLQNGPQSGC